jgi:hypothetical protein
MALIGYRWHGELMLAGNRRSHFSVTINADDSVALGTVWGAVHDAAERLAQFKWRYGLAIQVLPDLEPIQTRIGGFASPSAGTIG